MPKNKTKEEFVRDSKLVYGDIYDYSKSIYIKGDVALEIICFVHGSFFVSPQHHHRGHGCTVCYRDRQRISKLQNTSTYKGKLIKFIVKSQIIHNNKYDYSLVDFVHCNIPVKIVCPEHGKFEVKPKNHIHKGRGCPSCQLRIDSNGNVIPYVSCGFSLRRWLEFASDRVCYVYLVTLFNKDERFLKIGITSQTTIKERIKQCTNFYDFSVIDKIEGSAEFVYKKENEIQKAFCQFKYRPLYKIGGYTECFRIEALPLILNHIDKIKKRVGLPTQLLLAYSP